jgi:drug/metabolite transporter (DMT)-like permease
MAQTADTSPLDPVTPSPALGVAGAFAAIYLIWGSTYLGIRIAIESLPPLLMASCRFLLAGGLMYAWARLRGAPHPHRRHWPQAAWIGGFMLLGGNGGVSWAEQRVSSGAAALIIATVPIWVALLDSLRPGGRKPGAWEIAGLMLGPAGVALLVGPAAGASAERVDGLGAAVLIGAALSWTIGTLRAPRADLPKSKTLAIAMQMLCGGALLLVAGLGTGEWARFSPSAVTPRSILALLYLALFGSLVAFSAYMWLLHHCPPARVATYAFVNPIVAVFLGWALAGEPLGPRTLLAGSIIVSAVALIIIRPHSPARSPARS